VDVAKALIGSRQIELKITGIRPGEKAHETLVSEEEAWRTVERGEHYVILPILPELRDESQPIEALKVQYDSNQTLMTLQQVQELLRREHLMVDDTQEDPGKLIR
jgi:UDP-glucose 4-epimerase